MHRSACHKLTRHFAAFFKRLNPAPTYEAMAARAHSQITGLIEDKERPAGDLRARCFLQGSYKRDTAIHTINDVDIVALCSLSYAPTANRGTRDHVFEMIGDTIATHGTYRDKISYRKHSVCIKVLLEGVKIEILPALRVRGEPYEYEPFYMFRPSDERGGSWQQAFARRHQEQCSQKNSQTGGLFVPMIKVLKHLRSTENSLMDADAVSFHIECLLFSVRDSVYSGSTCECVEAVLRALAGFTPDKAEHSGIRSPCRDRLLFGPDEWDLGAYKRFNAAAGRWHEMAATANAVPDEEDAVSAWRQLLGDSYFPGDPQ